MTIREWVLAWQYAESMTMAAMARAIGLALAGNPSLPDRQFLLEVIAALPELQPMLDEERRAANRRARRQALELGKQGTAVMATPIALLRPALDLERAGLQALRSTNDIYRRVVAEAMAGPTDKLTRYNRAQIAMHRMAANGVPSFVDARGRRWNLSSYVEMATRAATARAELVGRLDGYAEVGRDLVIVSNAPEECHLCRPYEGKVFSLSGRDDRYPPLSGALSGGLHHPGCRHDERPFVPGVTKPFGPTADPEGDELRRKQRYLERRVRQAKQQALMDKSMAKAAGVPIPIEARHKVRQAQGALKQFIDEHDRKALPRRTSLGVR